MHLKLSLVCRFVICRTLRDTFVPNVRQNSIFLLKLHLSIFYYFYFVINKNIGFDHFPTVLKTKNYLSLSTCSNKFNHLCSGTYLKKFPLVYFLKLYYYYYYNYYLCIKYQGQLFLAIFRLFTLITDTYIDFHLVGHLWLSDI